MTTRWRPYFDPECLYFITTTTAGRARLFRRPEVYRILIDALYFISSQNRITLNAFVLMPNHIHVIVQCPETCPPKDWARAFKTSTARLLIRLYQVEQNQQALDFLASKIVYPKRQRYKVWEDGYLAKSVFTPDFLRQKIEYIHNNPLQPQWTLAESAEAYPWSSARYYLTGEPALIPVQNVWDDVVEETARL